MKALLFDVDGTLLDTREFILQATEHALKTHGYTVPQRAELSKHVSKPLGKVYQDITGQAEVGELENTHREFQLANLHLSVPFLNTVETLKTLKERGYRMAIVTTRSRKTSVKTLELAGVDIFFDTIISKEDTPAVKPDPTPLLKALEQLGCTPAEAIMIGDSELDVQAGKNAGTQTVRVTYGFHTEHLHDPKPDYIIDEIGKLTTILN